MDSRRPTRILLGHDAPVTAVADRVQRELQTARIMSIAVSTQAVEVEVEVPTRPASALLRTETVRGIPVAVVEDHSALLPWWLDQVGAETDLVVVHLDRHSDLGSPNLLRSGGHLIDRFTGGTVARSDRASVAAAVDSTAIEIGSFLTLGLWWLSPRALVWIHPPDFVPQTRGSGLRLGWTGVDPLLSSERRLRAEAVCDGDSDIVLHVLPGPAGLAAILDEHPESAVLLDLDLDYFDDSHEALDRRASLPDGARPSEAWLLLQDRALELAIDAIDPARVRAIGIARSPTFCPSRVADALVERVFRHLREWQPAARRP